MKLLYLLFYMVMVVLLGMWLSMAVAGAWANYALNQTTPSSIYFAVNISALVAWCYFFAMTIKGFQE
jgi:hypothetical protein